MGQAFDHGMVLVMSLWDDTAVNMLWLDSTYPADSDPSKPGNKRGPCSTSSGKPADVESQQVDASVTYSNIKTGPFCSTHPDAEDKLCSKVKVSEAQELADMDGEEPALAQRVQEQVYI